MNFLYDTSPVDIFPAPHVSSLSMQRLCDGLFLEMLSLKRAINNVDKKVSRASSETERHAFEWLSQQYQQTFQGIQSQLSQLQREISP